MSGSTSSQLGDILRNLRVRAGMSQDALAEASGISARTISDLERGQRASAHLTTIRLLAGALNVTDDQRSILLNSARPDASSSDDPSAPPHAARTPAKRWAASLPKPPTRFVGREHELGDLVTTLRTSSAGIVTLTGAGGVGKTRLAIEAGHHLAPEFADGAAFVDLTTVAHADRLPIAMAHALGLSANTPSPGQQLTNFLMNRQLLLIIDNLEHIIDGASFLARLNDDCPQLTMLVTSRVRLRLSNERELALAPLSLAEIADPFEQLQTNEANLLFADGASRADPNFTLTEQNAITVTEICRALDGIPLAIELAASRLRVLPAHELLERLEYRLPVLTGGNRDLHPRQQSIRNTIAWSYGLLATREQQFLRWMSVFVGGLSLESAEALGHALGMDRYDTLETVATLLDSAILRRTERHDGAPRYSAFETIREFGFEQLDIEGELDAARRFHAEHFLALARRDLRPPYDPILDEWLHRIDRERPNVIQAFDFLCHPETAEQAVRFAAPMAYFWRIKGPISEGHQRILKAIELAPEEPSVDKAHLLCCATYLLAMTPDRLDTYRTAHAAIEVTKYVGSPADKAVTLQALAFAEEQHEAFERARALFEEALGIWETLDKRTMQAVCHSLLGGIHYGLGEIERAQASEERAVELFLELGIQYRAASAVWYQGMFAFAQGRLDLAAQKYDQSLQLWLESDNERVWFKSFVGLADVAAAMGYFEPAAHFLGATDQLLREMGTELMPFDKPGYARARETCLRALGPRAFDVLVAAGKCLSPEEWLAESSAVVAYSMKHGALAL